MPRAKTYEDGLSEGQMILLEKTALQHALRLDHHSRRLAILERVCWITLGIIVTIQFIPAASAIVKVLTGG